MVDETKRGVFLWVFGREVGLLVVVALIAYYFWRLTRKARQPSPPALIWVLRISLACACVSPFIGLFLLGYDFLSFKPVARASGALVPLLVPLLVCVAALTGVWATLGTSRWSWPTLLACLVILSLHQLTPVLRQALMYLCGYRRSRESYSSLALILPLLVAVVATSRSVSSHLRRSDVKVDET
jgi:hypothetical protein